MFFFSVAVRPGKTRAIISLKLGGILENRTRPLEWIGKIVRKRGTYTVNTAFVIITG